MVKEATEEQAADPKALNLPLEFQFLWLRQPPEASLCPMAAAAPGPGLELFGLGLEQPRVPLVLQPWLCYLERWELLWDWLEDVVTPLSWEKPLVQDSRLDMDPLGGTGQKCC